MLKQVYELNLPPINDILLESFKGYDDAHLKYNYIVETDLTKIVKNEWLNFLGFNWHRMLYFKKNNSTGGIHTDATDPTTKIYDPTLTVWGLNWVVGGTGIMKFWSRNGVKKIGVTNGSLNIPDDGVVCEFHQTSSPIESYILQQKKVYLVNATLPHQATGMGPRIVYSLRPDVRNISWNNVVNIFEKFIKIT